MLTLSFTSSIIIIISYIMMTLASILSKKSKKNREKNSPFECGFTPISSSRIPFSIRFFLITIIFLIFDVEIALILPMIMIIKYSTPLIWMISSFFFIFILLIGLYHEWNQGTLKWTY